MHLILESISLWGGKGSGVVCIAALKHTFDFLRETRGEQKEQFDRLDSLLVKLEDKFHELGIPFVDSMEGYWRDRMKEVLAEQVPVNAAALRRIGVLTKEWDDESENESNNMSWNLSGKLNLPMIRMIAP